MNRPFKLFAVADDGAIFDEDYAKQMQLPFDQGWDHWCIYQGDHLVGAFPDFGLAQHTCAALNATIVLLAA